MVITRHGLEFFKLQFGDTVIAFNPPSKDSSHKSARFGADIVLSSINHPDFSGGDLLTAGEKKPFVITGPGEYEIQEIFVKGFPSESQYDKKKYINTVYLITMEGMNICFLGALANKDLPAETLEGLDEIDILFVPIGGDGVLTSVEAHKLAVKLEPAVIIPIHYDNEKSPALKAFLKEEGSDSRKPQDKLTLKPSNLTGEGGEIYVISQT